MEQQNSLDQLSDEEFFAILGKIGENRIQAFLKKATEARKEKLKWQNSPQLTDLAEEIKSFCRSHTGKKTLTHTMVLREISRKISPPVVRTRTVKIPEDGFPRMTELRKMAKEKGVKLSRFAKREEFIKSLGLKAPKASKS